MNPKREPIHLAGAELGVCTHVCAFFQTLDEEYRVLLPFVQEGIERGEKACHLVYSELRDEHMRRLQSAGIPVVEAEARGQLEVRSWNEIYQPAGHFNPDGMLAFIEDILQRGKVEGYPLTRLIIQKSWPLVDRPGVNDLLEYEARLDQMLTQFDDLVLCCYIVSEFGAGIILDVLRTHQMVIIGGILHENPFFVPPEQFLKELRARGS